MIQGLWKIPIALFLAACFYTAAVAQPKVAVKVIGTNELEFTLKPVVARASYQIIVRTNSQEGHWVALSGILEDHELTVTTRYQISPGSALASLGFSIRNLSKWSFAAFVGEDTDGDGLPDNFEELISKTDPSTADTGDLATQDGYRDPDGDNALNLEELEANTDPLERNSPPPPMAFGTQMRNDGTAVVSWTHKGDTLPEYFSIEQADPVSRPQPNQPPLAGRRRVPPNLLGNTFISGPYKEIAKVPPHSGQDDYQFIVTNVSSSATQFRLRAKYKSPPPRIIPATGDQKGILNTIRQVTSVSISNGFIVTVEKPVLNARYLLLCRESEKLPWRASGYFIATNTKLQMTVDRNGMLAAKDQRPVCLPDVSTKKPSAHLMFTTGSGEDGDGDGLPDIYEVLVTRTDPAKSITGNTQLLDGFCDADGDGFPNVSEFLHRTNPLKADRFDVISIARPTAKQVMELYKPPSDLPVTIKAEAKKTGETQYKAENFHLLFNLAMQSFRTNINAKLPFDLRVSYQVPNRLGHALLRKEDMPSKLINSPGAGRSSTAHPPPGNFE